MDVPLKNNLSCLAIMSGRLSLTEGGYFSSRDDTLFSKLSSLESGDVPLKITQSSLEIILDVVHHHLWR